MRRLLASLSALSMLVAAAGCTHVAGICDCDIPGYNCGYGCDCWHPIVPAYLQPAPAAAPAAPAAVPPKALPEGGQPGDVGKPEVKPEEM